MGSYRSRLEIIADVLSVARGGAKKTQIMYQANLSYKLLVRYLRYVMEAGLLASGSDDSYVLTEKGREFLDQYKGYSERREELDQRLDKMRNEKMMLETRFLNAEILDKHLKNCPKEQRNRGEKKGK